VLFIDEKLVGDHMRANNPVTSSGGGSRRKNQVNGAQRPQLVMNRVFFFEQIIPEPDSLVAVEFDCDETQDDEMGLPRHGSRSSVTRSRSPSRLTQSRSPLPPPRSGLSLAVVQAMQTLGITSSFSSHALHSTVQTAEPTKPSHAASGSWHEIPHIAGTTPPSGPALPAAPASASRPNLHLRVTDAPAEELASSQLGGDYEEPVKRIRGQSIAAETEICSRKHPRALPGLVQVLVLMENGRVDFFLLFFFC
jgi:hypothetical protein